MCFFFLSVCILVIEYKMLSLMCTKTHDFRSPNAQMARFDYTYGLHDFIIKFNRELQSDAGFIMRSFHITLHSCERFKTVFFVVEKEPMDSETALLFFI